MRSVRVFLLLALIVGEIVVVTASPAKAGRRGGEFPIPTPGAGAWGIAAGPDGNLWFGRP